MLSDPMSDNSWKLSSVGIWINFSISVWKNKSMLYLKKKTNKKNNKTSGLVLVQMAMHSITNWPAAKIHEAKYETGYMSILVRVFVACFMFN